MRQTAQTNIVATEMPDDLSPRRIERAPVNVLRRTAFDFGFPPGDRPRDVLIHRNALARWDAGRPVRRTAIELTR